MTKPKCFLPLLFCWVVPCFAWFTPQAIYKNLHIFILVASNLHHQLCLVKTLYTGKKPGFLGFPVDFPSSAGDFCRWNPLIFFAPRSWLQRRGCATSRRSWAMWTAQCDAVPRSGTPENGGLFLGNPMKMDDSEIPHDLGNLHILNSLVLSGWNFGPSSYGWWKLMIYGCYGGFLSHGGNPTSSSHGWKILVLKPTVTWGSHMDENMGDIVVFTQIWRDENGAIGCCTADLHGPSHSPTIVGVFLQTNNSSKTLPGSIRGLGPETLFAGDSRNRNDRGERKLSNVLKGWWGYAVWLFDIICCSLGRGIEAHGMRIVSDFVQCPTHKIWWWQYWNMSYMNVWCPSKPKQQPQV